jgi:AraC-like DNA-binding protein
MAWDLDFSARAAFEGESLFVGEWRCPGEKRNWATERSRYFEIGIQRVGAHVREIGGERRVVDAATLTVNAIGDEYRMASPTAHPQKSTVVLVRGDLLDSIAPLSARVLPLSAPVALLNERLLRMKDPVAIEETALALVLRATQESAPSRARSRPISPRRPSWRRLAEEIQHVVATRFAERLTIVEIAKQCGKSPFHVSRVFRAVTGSTIHAYLTRVRLRVALYEIARSSGELTSLALRAGFSSHSHFTSAFRREYGVGPSSLAGLGSRRSIG